MDKEKDFEENLLIEIEALELEEQNLLIEIATLELEIEKLELERNPIQRKLKQLELVRETGDFAPETTTDWKTFDDWKYEKRLVVMRGEKGTFKDGRYYFHKSQVTWSSTGLFSQLLKSWEAEYKFEKMFGHKDWYDEALQIDR